MSGVFRAAELWVITLRDLCPRGHALCCIPPGDSQGWIHMWGNGPVPAKPTVTYSSCPQLGAYCTRQPERIGYTGRVIFENEFQNNAFNI